MNLIKKTLINISIFAVVSFVCMVIFDKFLPYFTGIDHRDSSTYRSIRLREFFPNKTVKLIPTKDYIAHTDSLEVKEYDLRVNSDGYVIGPTDSQLKSEAFQEMLFKRIKYFLMPSSRCLSINRKSNRAPVISPT